MFRKLPMIYSVKNAFDASQEVGLCFECLSQSTSFWCRISKEPIDIDRDLVQFSARL